MGVNGLIAVGSGMKGGYSCDNRLSMTFYGVTEKIVLDIEGVEVTIAA